MVITMAKLCTQARLVHASRLGQQAAECAIRTAAEKATKDAEETLKIAAENASRVSTENIVVEAITTNRISPPFRPSSLLFPTDPPLKKIPNPDARNDTIHIAIAALPIEDKLYLLKEGYLFSENKIVKTVEHATSEPSLPQTPHQFS